MLVLILGSCKPKTTSLQTELLDNQQELTQKETNQDSLHWLEEQHLENEFNSYPTLSTEEIASIAPIIEKWTDFYKLDFSKARFIDKKRICLDCPPDTLDVYYREYAPEQNSSKLIEMFYSPDKQRYVDIGILCENINGKYYDTGNYDDSQAVYFIDRRLKYIHNLFYFGISAGIETVFWKSNDEFILVGRDFFGEMVTHFFVYEYNIPNRTVLEYNMLVPHLEEKSYREQIYKEKEIVVDYEEYKKLKSE